MSNQKSRLLSGVSSAVSSVVELPKNDPTNTLDGNFKVQPGDIIKSKQKDKTKSPYSTVVGFNHAAKQVNIIAFDAPGYGNRHARRVRYAKKKGKT